MPESAHRSQRSFAAQRAVVKQEHFVDGGSAVELVIVGPWHDHELVRNARRLKSARNAAVGVQKIVAVTGQEPEAHFRIVGERAGGALSELRRIRRIERGLQRGNRSECFWSVE